MKKARNAKLFLFRFWTHVILEGKIRDIETNHEIGEIKIRFNQAFYCISSLIWTVFGFYVNDLTLTISGLIMLLQFIRSVLKNYE